MTELRQRMIDEMTLRGFSPKTHEAYLGAVTGLACFYKQSPDKLSLEQVRQYLLHLERDRHLSWSSLNVAVSGFRFLYFQTLKWNLDATEIPKRQGQSRLPEVLSRDLFLHLPRLSLRRPDSLWPTARTPIPGFLLT